MASSIAQNTVPFGRISGPPSAAPTVKSAFPLDLSHSSAIYRLYAAAMAAAATKPPVGPTDVLQTTSDCNSPDKSAFTPCQPSAFAPPPRPFSDDLTVIIPAHDEKATKPFVLFPTNFDKHVPSANQPLNLAVSGPNAIVSKVPLVQTEEMDSVPATAPSTSSPSAASSGDGGSPAPVRKTPRKELVRDAAYWERRRKNNDAAKRSRDSRRKKEDEVTVRAALLERENLRLRFEIERLRGEVERHRILTMTPDYCSHATLTVIGDNNHKTGVDFIIDNNSPAEKIFVVDVNNIRQQQATETTTNC